MSRRMRFTQSGLPHPDQIVPLLAEAAGQPINPGVLTPLPSREYAAQRTGLQAPDCMTDGASAKFEPFEWGYIPSDPMDRAIRATRKAVFPLHGLMPL